MICINFDHLLNTKSNPRPTSFQHGVHILRGLAILLVLCDHFLPTLFPSGFVGVDIFFLISGYVITHSLLKKNYTTFASFIASFYKQRINRILPLLISSVFIISILTILVSPSPGVSLKTGVTALVGASNIFLIKNSSDYFAESSSFNTFLQTWSLSVEEQFYLLYPIIFWLTYSVRRRKSLLACILIGLISASLFFFCATLATSPELAYYSMPTRFWGLASGCLLALYAHKVSALLPFFGNNLSTLRSTILILLISISFLPADSGALSHIFVVILSIIFICITLLLPYKACDLLILQHFADISYSWYIWHWSLLSLALHIFGSSVFANIFVLPLSYIVSIASWKHLESLPKKLSIPKIIGVFVAALVSVLAVSSFLSFAILRKKPLLYLGDLRKYTNSYNSHCFYQGSFPGCQTNKNTLSAFSSRTIHIVGDSHAAHYASAAALSYLSKYTSLTVTSVPGQPFPSSPIIRSQDKATSRQGNSNQKKIQSQLLSSTSPGDLIIITNSGSYFVPPLLYVASESKSGYEYYSSDDYLTRSSFSQFVKQFIGNLSDFLAVAKKKGVNVIYFLPPPSFSSTSFSQCHPILNVFPPSRQCLETLSLPEYLSRRSYLERSLQELTEHYSNLLVYDPSPIFCNQINCSRYIKKQLFVDGSHLSAEGSLPVARDSFEKISHLGLPE